MKKTLCTLLALALLAALPGCGGSSASGGAPEHLDASALTPEQLAQAAERESQYLSWFGGYVGERVEGNRNNWLYNAYESNPLMLDSIRQKDLTDISSQVNFWYGMFVPGILRGAAGCWELDRDPVLYEKIEALTAESLRCWDTYGSVEYDADSTEFPLINPSWLNGVMAWYDATGSAAALELAVKMGDYYIEKAEVRGINDTMPMIGLAQLCLATGEERFYRLLDQYELAWSWTGGDYHRAAQNGTDFCDTYRHNWENAFEVQALGPLADVRQDPSYLESLDFMWNSILRTERRSTGAYTTQESAAGTPYADGSAETCANVTWLALTAEQAARSKSSYVVDELEMTFWNVGLGAQGTAGRWWTYDTPQEGYRVASIDELNWQSIQGSPEFSCCMSNCSLGIATLADWCTLRDEGGVYVNYYGESEFLTATPGGQALTLTQRTAYPADGKIVLTLSLSSPEEFQLHLRIPVWSEHSSVSLNGKALETPVAGGYYSLSKAWKDGDTLEIDLDMVPHYWAAGEGHSGQVSLYRGPLLLALDQRFNPNWSGSRMPLELSSLQLEPVEYQGYPDPLVVLQATDASGTSVLLCDFATAGQSGTYYTTWFLNNQLETPSLQRGICPWNQRLGE